VFISSGQTHVGPTWKAISYTGAKLAGSQLDSPRQTHLGPTWLCWLAHKEVNVSQWREARLSVQMKCTRVWLNQASNNQENLQIIYTVVVFILKY